MTFPGAMQGLPRLRLASFTHEISPAVSASYLFVACPVSRSRWLARMRSMSGTAQQSETLHSTAAHIWIHRAFNGSQLIQMTRSLSLNVTSHGASDNHTPYSRYAPSNLEKTQALVRRRPKR
jgi:hypothetical protein